MSKGSKKYRLQPWLSAKVNCDDGRFLQVGNSLLLSPRFHELTQGAQMTYLCMALESGGRREFVFPQAAAKKYNISPASLRRHVKELERQGFLIVRSMASLRRPNQYQFSLIWKGIPPAPIPWQHIVNLTQNDRRKSQ